MTKVFEGQVAFVTGAASGMGLAAAKKFAEAGAAVAVVDVNEAAAKKTADEIIKNGGKAVAIQCDVSNEQQVKAAVEKTVQEFGRLDAAFNNAGIQSPVIDTADLESVEWDRILNINLKGVWLCMKYELQQMVKQGNGTIVNNSSLGGLVANPGRAAYHAAKHGVLGLTKCAAVEYATRNIRVNAVCPGTIETPMVSDMFATGDLDVEKVTAAQPVKRLGKAEEVADVVLWLCGPTSTYVIGQSISVDGGYTIV